MPTSNVIAQLLTMNLDSSIRFYTKGLGFDLEFQHEDFYAGIRAGNQSFHIKLVDERDPSIDFVARGGHFHLYFEVTDISATAESLRGNGIQIFKDIHKTSWNTSELVIKDDQGHTLYFGQPG